MVVNNGSRFKGQLVYLDDSRNREDGGIQYLSQFRDNQVKRELGDIYITFEEGMRLDSLAHEYYGNPLLEWVIMDANPNYLSPFMIKVGDTLCIPNPERVLMND